MRCIGFCCVRLSSNIQNLIVYILHPILQIQKSCPSILEQPFVSKLWVLKIFLPVVCFHCTLYKGVCCVRFLCLTVIYHVTHSANKNTKSRYVDINVIVCFLLFVSSVKKNIKQVFWYTNTSEFLAFSTHKRSISITLHWVSKLILE